MDVRWISQQPFWALVDDDLHSARLFTRTLLDHGAPVVRWMDGALAGISELGELLAGTDALLPSLVVVDLKNSSSGTRDFIAALRRLPGADKLLVVGMTTAFERSQLAALLEAGADAAFERHPEVGAYRREAANIVQFQARREGHLVAVGT